MLLVRTVLVQQAVASRHFESPGYTCFSLYCITVYQVRSTYDGIFSLWIGFVMLYQVPPLELDVEPLYCIVLINIDSSKQLSTILVVFHGGSALGLELSAYTDSVMHQIKSKKLSSKQLLITLRGAFQVYSFVVLSL